MPYDHSTLGHQTLTLCTYDHNLRHLRYDGVNWGHLKLTPCLCMHVYVCTCWTHTHTQWLFVHFPLKFMFKSLSYKGSKRCSRLSHWSHWSFKNHGLLFFFPDVDVWKEEILSSGCSQLQCRGVGLQSLLTGKGDVIKTSCLETYYFELGNL